MVGGSSSTTKTGRHDIAEILLKVALKHQKSKPVYGHLTLRHFRLYKVHSYLLTVLNTGFLQSDQVQRYIYKINWLNIKVLKTTASSKSINLYLYTFIIKCSQLIKLINDVRQNFKICFVLKVNCLLCHHRLSFLAQTSRNWQHIW